VISNRLILINGLSRLSETFDEGDVQDAERHPGRITVIGSANQHNVGSLLKVADGMIDKPVHWHALSSRSRR